MFNFFHRPELADESSLSRFVRNASSAEKKKVYVRVIQRATEEQNRTITEAAARRHDEQRNSRAAS